MELSDDSFPEKHLKKKSTTQLSTATDLGCFFVFFYATFWMTAEFVLQEQSLN